MKAWFYGLQPRERWIVAIGAAAAIVIIVWGFVVRPLRAEMAALRTSVDTKQRLLIDVARIEREQPSKVVDGLQGVQQTLTSIVSDTAGSHSLTLQRTRANGASGVDVSLQDAPFDTLAAWLIVLHTNYGVDVESASFSSARQPGLVNGQLTLRRL